MIGFGTVAALWWVLLQPARLVRWALGGRRYSNCVIFALALFCRRWAKGRRERRLGVTPPDQYLVIRVSRAPWAMAHFLYGEMDETTGQVRVVSYKSLTNEKTGLRVLFPGRAAWGDRQPVHLSRSTACWLDWMRRDARSGGFGVFPVTTMTGGQVVIFDDEVNACCSNEALYEFIQKRCEKED